MSENSEPNEQQFWAALGHQQEWLEAPQKVVDDPIYMMRTRAGFIFDDAFWGVFHRFPFKVCHVAYYGPARLEDGERMQDTGIFELRFAPKRQGKEETWVKQIEAESQAMQDSKKPAARRTFLNWGRRGR